MEKKITPINRRFFLKKSLLGIGGLAFTKNRLSFSQLNDQWPDADYLGRNTVYLPSSLPVRSKPTVDASVIRYLAEDECLIWNQEVIGESPIGRVSKKWVETPEGYVYGPSLQKVKNIPNSPVLELPANGETGGMWVEVTQPYVQLELDNQIAQSPWLQNLQPSLWRLYYGQVIWCDGIRQNEDGVIQYHLSEKYGYDYFWANAEAFRPLSIEEVTPISPEVGDKKIVVNANQQTLSCYEGNNEVFYCQVSTGIKLDEFGLPDDTFATPKGEHFIWRKAVSFHMGGGARDDGWDIIAVPWTSLFVGSGVAIHGTFWHNDYGTPKSHGCVNVTPENAKWIFRWTAPSVSYYPGDYTDNTFTSTKIQVIDPEY